MDLLIASGEPTPLFWMVVFCVLVFAVQLAVCLKVKKTAGKCIPLYLIGGGFLFGGATCAGLFGTSSAGAISGNGLAGLVILAVAAAASLGAAVAWLVYWIVKAKTGRRQ